MTVLLVKIYFPAAALVVNIWLFVDGYTPVGLIAQKLLQRFEVEGVLCTKRI